MMMPIRLTYTDAFGTKVLLAQSETGAQPSTPKGTGDAPEGQAPSGSPLGLIFPLAIAFVIIFMWILPQRRKDKQRRQMLSELRKGERVVTIGGIHGEVTQVTDDSIILLTDSQKGTTLKMARSAVSRILAEDEEGAEAES